VFEIRTAILHITMYVFANLVMLTGKTR